LCFPTEMRSFFVFCRERPDDSHVAQRFSRNLGRFGNQILIFLRVLLVVSGE
jgi:hypothetical protein